MTRRPLALVIGSWTLAGMVALGATSALADSSEKPAESTPHPRASIGSYRTARPMLPATPDRAWWGAAAITAALAVCGGMLTIYRRLFPATGAGAMQVVGRMSLSPRHNVYVVRVGTRMLLVGTGPQGAPSLITELDESRESGPEERA